MQGAEIAEGKRIPVFPWSEPIKLQGHVQGATTQVRFLPVQIEHQVLVHEIAGFWGTFQLCFFKKAYMHFQGVPFSHHGVDFFLAIAQVHKNGFFVKGVGMWHHVNEVDRRDVV